MGVFIWAFFLAAVLVLMAVLFDTRISLIESVAFVALYLLYLFVVIQVYRKPQSPNIYRLRALIYIQVMSPSTCRLRTLTCTPRGAIETGPLSSEEGFSRSLPPPPLCCNPGKQGYLADKKLPPLRILP